MATVTPTYPYSKQFPGGLSQSGGNEFIMYGLEAASQTADGSYMDPVNIVSGALTAMTLGTNITTSNPVAGLLKQSFSGTTSTQLQYMVFDPNRTYRYPCYSGASAAAGSIALIGTKCPIKPLSGGYGGLVVDTSTTTNGAFLIERIVTENGNALTDTGVLLEGKWVAAALQIN